MGFTLNDVFFLLSSFPYPHSGKGTDPKEEEEIVLKDQFKCPLGRAAEDGENAE